MSLALNLFFWDSWSGTTTDTTTDGGSGGGGKKRKRVPRPKLQDDHPIDTGFWDVREQYIRENTPVIEPEPTVEPDDDTDEQIARLNEQRSSIIIAIRSAKSSSDLQTQSARLTALNREITTLLGKQAVNRLRQ